MVGKKELDFPFDQREFFDEIMKGDEKLWMIERNGIFSTNRIETRKI